MGQARLLHLIATFFSLVYNYAVIKNGMTGQIFQGQTSGQIFQLYMDWWGGFRVKVEYHYECRQKGRV